MLRKTKNFYSRIIVLNEIMYLQLVFGGKNALNYGGNASNEFILFLCPWYPRLIFNFMCIWSKICNHIIVVHYYVEPPLLNKKKSQN
jgi:hypothetical protein